MSDECSVCISRDRDVLVQPAVKTRIRILLLLAIATMRARPTPREFRNLDGYDPDPFVAYGDQLNGTGSILLEHYTYVAEEVCSEIVEKLPYAEVAILAAYSQEFWEFWCEPATDREPTLQSRFYPYRILARELVRLLGEAAANRTNDEEREPPDRS